MKTYRCVVFVDEKGERGDPLTVIIDSKNTLDEMKRMELARGFGNAETAFIESLQPARVRFYNPAAGEVSFAGQPMIGTAHILAELTSSTTSLITCSAGEVSTWKEDGITWTAKNTLGLPGWKFEQFASVEDINVVKTVQTTSWSHKVIWAWENEALGEIRMRTFAPDWGITEAESNGSGAMLLAAQLGRHLEIRHGHGSVLYAQPLEDGLIALGGRCRLVTERTQTDHENSVIRK
jgi:predicted PhzF superfamily epimerase YddE/YHI9